MEKFSTCGREGREEKGSEGGWGEGMVESGT